MHTGGDVPPSTCRADEIVIKTSNLSLQYKQEQLSIPLKDKYELKPSLRKPKAKYHRYRNFLKHQMVHQ